MRAPLRSARLLLLAWAILLAPQMAFVHLLSHGMQAATAGQEGRTDPRHPTVAKVCDTCLALGQIGSAMPAAPHAGVTGAASLPSYGDPAHASVLPRRPALFEARGPPFLPT
jgi:hypothetical protein